MRLAHDLGDHRAQAPDLAIAERLVVREEGHHLLELGGGLGVRVLEAQGDAELEKIKAHANQLFSLEADDAAFGDSIFNAALAEVETYTSRDGGTGNYNQFWLADRDWNHRTPLIV